MLYTLSTDNGNGQPVKNAKISFSKDGVVFNEVDFPNNTGVLYFDSVADSALFADGVAIRLTAFGYNPAGVIANSINGDWVFTMRPNGLSTTLMLGSLLTVAVLYGGARNNNLKIAGVGKIDPKKDILPWLPIVAIGVGGYLLYDAFFTKSPQDQARDAALSNDIETAAAQVPPRMTDSEIAATANALVEDLSYSHPFGDSDQQLDAAHQLTKPVTLADLLRLIKQYGKHMITYFGIPAGSFTLEETVTRKLDADVIAEINAYYDAQGINFNF